MTYGSVIELTGEQIADCQVRSYPPDAEFYMVDRPSRTRMLIARKWPVQRWIDEYRARERIVCYAGPCVVCQIPTWYHLDGSDGERGVLAENTLARFEAADFGMLGRDMCVCVGCAYPGGFRFNIALSRCKTQWRRTSAEELAARRAGFVTMVTEYPALIIGSPEWEAQFDRVVSQPRGRSSP
jgi:hypothetical protein